MMTDQVMTSPILDINNLDVYGRLGSRREL